MFDIGWSELLLIGIVALIVIGPKDLPEMFRTLGRFTAKARGMAREFSRAMEAAADEAGVKDVAKDIKDAANVRSMGLDTMKDAARKFEAWDPLKPAKAAAAAPVVAVGPKPAEATPADAQPEAEAAPAPEKPMGPATAALAEARAAKRAAAKAAAATKAAAAKGDA